MTYAPEKKVFLQDVDLRPNYSKKSNLFLNPSIYMKFATELPFGPKKKYGELFFPPLLFVINIKV